MTDANEPLPPPGVELTDWNDFPKKRQQIFDGVKQAVQESFPQSQGGVRLELHNLGYENAKPFSLAEQKKALMSDQYLHHKLRGTLRLIDEKTGAVLDEQHQTLLKTPYLTERGTFIYNGSELSTISQARLQPGIYSRRKANGELEAHCFHHKVKVLTSEGWLPIGQIVNQKLNVDVYSYDFVNKCFVLKPVVGWFKNTIKSRLGRADVNSVARSPVSSGSFNPSALWVTPEHKMLTLEGNKIEIRSAQYLTVVEEEPSANQCQVLYGSLLGDGHISTHNLYEEAHSLDQVDYLQWKHDMLGGFVSAPLGHKPAKGNRQEVVTLRTKACIFMQKLRLSFYPNGVKIVPRDLIENLTALGLACWYGDDGYAIRSKYKGNVSSHLSVLLSTNCFTQADVNWIISWFERKWGLKASKLKNSKDIDRDMGWVVRLGGADAERFLDIVAPYLHPSLKSKLAQRVPMGRCIHGDKEITRVRYACNACMVTRYANGKAKARERQNTRSRLGHTALAKMIKTGIIVEDNNLGAAWDRRVAALGTALTKLPVASGTKLVLASIPCVYDTNTGTKLSKTNTAYDIEVEGTHNYIANGVLVSNCNAKRGSGQSFRVSLEPESGLFKLNIGQSSLRLYSLLHDIGVPDEQLEKTWGKDLLASNKAAYDSRVFDKAYNRFVRRADPAASREQKAEAIKAALAQTYVDHDTTRKTLPNLFKE